MKVLIAIDGSDHALLALRHALRLAREGLALEPVLANVQEPASLYELVVAHDPDVLARVAVEAGAHALDAAEALCREAGVGAGREVAVGDPGPMLIELAEDHGCEVIVLGARGRGDERRALLGPAVGTVAQRVLREAGGPVWLVRPAPAEG